MPPCPAATPIAAGCATPAFPAYGISGLFSDPGNNGVHGRNEQVGVKAVYDSKEFLYRLVQQLAGPGKSNP